jgi:hypothetical protein
MAQNQDQIGRIAEQFSNDSRIKACKTYKEVRDSICTLLAAHYHCATKYVLPYADDIAESVCLKLNIPQD